MTLARRVRDLESRRRDPSRREVWERLDSGDYRGPGMMDAGAVTLTPEAFRARQEADPDCLFIIVVWEEAENWRDL